jgi:Winged helix DNA-binding domain
MARLKQASKARTPVTTWDQVRARRQSRHHLDRRVPKARLLDVVRDVSGIHAQVQSSAELQLWARVDGISRDDVQDALWDQRSLVRTWSLRGTLHLLTAEDLPLYVAALQQHDRWWKGAWLRMIGMTEQELRATLEAIRDSLGARPLTREQLADKVAAKVGAKARDRMMSGWGEMLKPAAFHGYLVSGPPRGQSVSFVRPDRWLGKWNVPAAENAWREIVRRYLRAYGPATREEFARWWGMQPAPAGRVMKALADELTDVDVEGHRASALTEEIPALARARLKSPVRLLPAFDVYIVGTRPRESLVESRFEHLIFRQAGWISPVVLIDGRARGVWKHERTRNGIEVAVSAFGKLSGAHREAIAREAESLGRFLDAPATVSFGSA